jgi:stearoyl-CoA desaturase (delta-9 desaturase)
MTANEAAPTRSDIDLPVAFVFFGVHLAALTAFVVPPTAKALVLLLAWFAVSGFGITVGFHRLLSHQAFACGVGLKRVFATMGTLALQGGPAFWVGLHRRHHRCADRDGDPHSPRERFLEGHMLWMLRRSTKNAAVLAALTFRDLRELGRDPYMRWLDRGVGPLLPWLASILVCGLVAGVEGVVWGGLVRTAVGWHATWLVNSVGHRWGAQPHATNDDSRNVVWLTPIAFGDQWHNNHHADPRKAVLTERWWQIDPSGWLILLLQHVGLASNVRGPKRPRTQQSE